MPLYLYNTLKRSKERFHPVDEEHIKMYVCGPTVYNYVHIGNARPVVVFDTLYRVLNQLFPKVTYARNITDIDDKIMNTAAETGRSIEDITGEYTQAYAEDMAQLCALEPDVVPKATEHLPEMIEMTQTLIEKGHAYESEGHVLFAVESMDDYGKLSNRKLEDMMAGARVEVASYKRYAGDFVLWKPSADHEPGWDSPWGRGRPGWHLECSAMIKKHLGRTIDIHGGGKDLVFPHHENEIAQSQCCHDGDEYVRYWMHNGYLSIDGEKMSKSLGNFKTVRELLQSYHGEVLRFALLSGHYRSDIDFSKELLDQSKAALDSMYAALRKVSDVDVDDVVVSIADEEGFAALCDDLNTPMAISSLHKIAGDLNKAEGDDVALAKARLLALADMLGLLNEDADVWFQGGEVEGLSGDQIEALIQERNDAKKAKNFARADEIRGELTDAGIVLEDSREGTKWRRA